MKVNGSYIVKHRPNGPDTEEVVEIDFTPPFRRVAMIPELERVLKCKFPAGDTLGTPEGTKFLSDLCTKNKVRFKINSIKILG